MYNMCMYICVCMCIRMYNMCLNAHCALLYSIGVFTVFFQFLHCTDPHSPFNSCNGMRINTKSRRKIILNCDNEGA